MMAGMVEGPTRKSARLFGAARSIDGELMIEMARLSEGSRQNLHISHLRGLARRFHAWFRNCSASHVGGWGNVVALSFGPFLSRTG